MPLERGQGMLLCTCGLVCQSHCRSQALIAQSVALKTWEQEVAGSNLQLCRYSCRELMINISTGFIPLPIVSSMVMWGSSQWLGKNIVLVNPCPHSNTFWRPWERSLLKNTVSKGEIARNEQFLLFPQCFLPVWIAFSLFRQIWNCLLQTLSVWKSLKFVVW